MSLRIVSWNVNSLRTRIDLVAGWLDQHLPDVITLQETKCNPDQFAPLAETFTERGYEVAHHGVDHWNGVAIASRAGLDEVRKGFAGHQEPPFDEARIISGLCGSVRVASVYVPNGRTLDDDHYLYKLVWLERLRGEAAVGGWADRPTVITGDFNVAPTDQDIYDPSRWRNKTHASPQERAAITALADLGFVDAARTLHPDSHQFTWWSYRQAVGDEPGQDRGLRIDLAMVSKALWPSVTDCWVDRRARMVDQPSDHAPLVLDLDDTQA